LAADDSTGKVFELDGRRSGFGFAALDDIAQSVMTDSDSYKSGPRRRLAKKNQIVCPFACRGGDN
jgi:hypothetical protein